MKKEFTASIPYPLFLLRHGKTDYNKRFEDGGYVEVHGQLSDIGKDQVNKAIEKLLPEVSSKIVKLVTSPKRRCYQTADLLMNALEAKHEVILEINNGFRDVDILTICAERPKGSYAVWESDLQDGHTWLDGWKGCEKFYPGEESPKMLHVRVVNSFQNLVIDMPTIIVCHEEVMLALADHLGIQTTRPTYAEVWIIRPRK